jgi:hypothetical protein
MKKMNRRKFAMLAGGAALAPGVAAGFAPQPRESRPAQSAATPAAQQPPAAGAKPKYGMTAEQEERVKQSIERRERQNAALRSRTLPYALEAAFVFQARVAATRPENGKAKTEKRKT